MTECSQSGFSFAGHFHGAWRPLALRVQHQNGSEILTSNGASLPVHNAEYAVLRIAYGARSREVRLQRNQLGAGLLVYLPEGPDPKFRMLLYTPSAGR